MQPGFPEPAPPLQRPVRVQLEKTSSPTVTYAIMGLTVFVYLLQMFGQQFYGQDYAALYGLKDNLAIYHGQFYRLFTPMLLHGSLLHIGFNMYALFVIGTRLERVMGHGRFAALYIVSGFAGNVMSFLFQPAPSLGASTAIFGILSAEAVFIYMNRQYVVNARAMLTNIITLLLGISIGATMAGDKFLTPITLMILALGFVAIVLDTVSGVLFGKLMCALTHGRINPLIGAAGISAYPMAARVVQVEGQRYNRRNYLLMHAMGANTGGQIGSIMAAAIMLSIVNGLGIH